MRAVSGTDGYADDGVVCGYGAHGGAVAGAVGGGRVGGCEGLWGEGGRGGGCCCCEGVMGGGLGGRGGWVGGLRAFFFSEHGCVGSGIRKVFGGGLWKLREGLKLLLWESGVLFDPTSNNSH